MCRPPPTLDASLQAIDAHLDQALAIADHCGEHLLAALISQAHDALLRRHAELGGSCADLSGRGG